MQDQSPPEVPEVPSVELKHLIQKGSNEEYKGSFDTARIEQPQRLSYLESGWQKGVAASCVCNIIVLIFNSALLIWSRSRPVSSDGNYILWQGAYESMKSFDGAAHLAINVASTIILAGSNYALQILVAPTRKDIDRAHREERSMDIGISSFHNWRYVSRSRKVLYACLFAVTIPIHVLYNSIIIATAATFDPGLGGVVTNDFLEIPPGNASYSTVWNLASNNKLTNMSTNDCFHLCEGSGACEYSNRLFFSDLSSKSQSSSWYYSGPITSTYSYYPDGLGIGCTPFLPPGSWLYSLSDWMAYTDSAPGAKITVCEQINSSQQPSYVISSANDGSITFVGAQIEYCLAESAHFSTIELIPQLLIIVIICNILKIGALCFLMFSRFRPIVTIGDAITSFLDSPDSATKHLGPISAMELQRLKLSVPLINMYNKAWKGRNHLYYRALTPLRWWLTFGLCFSYWLLGIVLLGLSGPSGYDFRLQLDEGLGDPESAHTLGPMTLAQSILLANTPQVVLSAIYLCYNALFTCILLSLEWLSYCKHKKGLRVTTPEGEQRGTYFLSLPYRVSIPLGVASMLLHWLLSQSIFVVRINTYTSDRTLVAGAGSNTIGTSTLALALGLVLGGLLIHAMIVVTFGKLESAMPLVRSESIAISAACHPAETNGERISIKKLQYGVISELPSGRYRVGFSNGEVRPLVPGEFYE